MMTNSYEDFWYDDFACEEQCEEYYHEYDYFNDFDLFDDELLSETPSTNR